MSEDAGAGTGVEPADGCDERASPDWGEAGGAGDSYRDAAADHAYVARFPAAERSAEHDVPGGSAGTAFTGRARPDGLRSDSCVPEVLADGILAGAGLSGSHAVREILRLNLTQFFAEGCSQRTEPAVSGAVRPGGSLVAVHGTRAVASGLASRSEACSGALSETDRARDDRVRDDRVRALGVALRAELEVDGSLSRAAAETVAAVLTAQLGIACAHDLEVRPVARGGLAPHILRRVTERMAHDFAEELDLPTLAAEARLSPWHFARAFKQSTGEPPHAYRTRLRIEQAKSLLTAGEAPVMEIAEAVGYDSPQSLARAFRKQTGRSPSAFRRAARA